MQWLLRILLGVMMFAAPVSAQTKNEVEVDASTRVVDSISSPEVNYREISKSLTKTEESLKSNKITVNEISNTVKFLSETRAQLADGKKRVEKELNFVQKRIDALGEAPADGSEPPLIAGKRKEFSEEASSLKSKIAEIDLMLTRIDELDSLIVNVRNQKLLGNLMERQLPLIYPAVFFNDARLFVEFGIDAIRSPVDWFQELNTEGRDFVKSNLLPVTVIFLLCLWLGIYLRFFIMRHFGYDNSLEHISYGRKVSAAIAVAVGYGVIPAFLIGGLLLWMLNSQVMTLGFFGILINSFLYFTLVMILCKAVARVIFAPYNERWRLISFSTDKAIKVTHAVYVSILLIGLTAYLEYVAEKAGYSLELIGFLTSVSNAAKAFSIAWIVKRLVWEDLPENEEDDDSAQDDGDGDDEALSRSLKITFLTSVFALGVFLLSLFGYPYLSAFIFNKLIASVLVVGAIVIFRKAVNEALRRMLLWRFWVHTFRLRRKIIRKINFWSGLVLDPVFIILGGLILLSLWGVSTDILIQTTIKVMTGFTVGGIEISPLAIIIGLIVFFFAIAAVRAMKVRLLNNVLGKMDMDDGLKHSLASGFGFFGFTIAALLSFAIMGGNLRNFALVAGAFSVGIGLGLQNVVNNFVSGIILLFERPIKVGDWVIINGEEGKVKQINIRSTEVETFKRSSVIIPNASLLSGTVTNLTHSNNWARYAIKVGVAYGSDTDQVRAILLEAAQSNRKVLKKPAPYVLFQDFGASSLEFELRVYVSDIWEGWIVPSDLRYEINRRFREEGIEIPFNQLVVHHGSEVSKATESQFYAANKKKGSKNAAEESEK
ncbi:MAG: mechanosensitive ion channel [Alphaproteobacteria bacterium]|nr:mechanosensitive ion channel [Alphaproteobacteria bacterium]